MTPPISASSIGEEGAHGQQEGVVSEEGGFSRRTILATPVVLAFTSNSACAQEGGTRRMMGSKTLVAYLTRSGNTRVIAETLHRALNADLFEIRPARPYPEDYEQHVAQAARERDSGFEPPLATRVENIASYDEIFLGFPVWGETTPPPIRSFLRAHDLMAKTLRPFITHGGYGVGNSPSVLASHAKGVRIEEPFVMEADQERRMLNEINGWLGRIRG
jgi:flavodoxin